MKDKSHSIASCTPDFLIIISISVGSSNLGMDVVESKGEDVRNEELSKTKSDTIKLDILNDCETKVLSILQITQDSLSELQNVPDINAERLNNLSKAYLDLVISLQSEIKSINSTSHIVSADSSSVSNTPMLSNASIIEDSNNLIIKRIDMAQARNFLKYIN